MVTIKNTKAENKTSYKLGSNRPEIHSRPAEIANVGAKIATAELPQSLNWFYGFGFKVAIFMILKSVLILRYQAFNLSLVGILMLLTYTGLSTTMIVCGLTMQNNAMYDSKQKLRKASIWYGLTTLVRGCIMVLKVVGDWKYFKNPDSVNWFMDFFSGIFKGSKELGLSLLFIDCDFLVALCGLLFLVTFAYRKINFE